MLGLFDTLGAAGVGLLIFLDNFFPPIPSEVVLPLAGFRARTGAIDPVLVWPAATAGAVAGSLVVYYLGVWLGYDRLHDLAGRRWFVIASRRDLERGRDLFDRHGGKMVLLGRCIPFVRSVISVPAGVAGMPVCRFLLLTTIGSGIWNALLIGLGWYLGENWTVLEEWTGVASSVVVGLVLVAVGVLVLRRASSRRATGTSTTAHRDAN
ncbi:DedA family protein [Pseudonocardia sp. KRD-169]|uniref:DedA family protein n=1 Tax=Pseudonocardia abyssalis TaxID=2792008 RepID=A0ABS6UMI5_9PSEU|nr:DedA family protein [Pseudonocardia abyssalis]MBW0133151.1 DedA family protein [Pseudonocardia abyssalis]